MGLAQTRLDLAVKIAVRAAPSVDPSSATVRLAAFREAYDVLTELSVAVEPDVETDWSEELLEAAWDLVRDAHGRGTPVETIVGDLVAAHACLVEKAAAPVPQRRRKQRRDA